MGQGRRTAVKVQPSTIRTALSFKLSVIVVGMGKRGMHHATAFHANGRFEVVGICDIDQARLEPPPPSSATRKIGTDAARAGRGRQARHFLLLHAAAICARR